MTKIEMPDDGTIPEHYTAHVIVDPAHTPGEYCTVSVTEDRVDLLGEVTWGSKVILDEETSVVAAADEDAIVGHATDDAERLLTEAGWRVIGDYGWQPTDWGWYQRVERVAATD